MSNFSLSKPSLHHYPSTITPMILLLYSYISPIQNRRNRGRITIKQEMDNGYQTTGASSTTDLPKLKMPAAPTCNRHHQPIHNFLKNNQAFTLATIALNASG